MRTMIANIGECFTGDIDDPMASIKCLLIDNGVVAAFDPPAETLCDAVIDARGGAVLPGLVDGHVHPVLGEWTPTQDAMGWMGNYLHGGTTSMVSAGELHTPGLDYANLTPELVTSLATVMRATTGRMRWSGVKLYAGTVLLVPGMTEAHFDRLAEAGVRFAKFLFFPLGTHRDEAERYVSWCRQRAIRVKVHTGGVSRSGLSTPCGFEILFWLQPDIAAHVSGGPIPMHDEDLFRTIEETTFALEVCSSGNDRSTRLAVQRLRDLGQLRRLCLGTDTPGGTGVIPRGMWRNILFMSGICELTPGEAIAVATGNTARAHGLDVGLLRVGSPADLIVCGPVQGSTGHNVADAIAHGDIPGVSSVLIDGEIIVKERSRQTPPPERPSRFFCSPVGEGASRDVILGACACC